MNELLHRLTLAAAILLSGAAGRAEAGSVAYDISGQFGPELFPGGTDGLAGGSFQGTFSAMGLPIPSSSSLTLDSFDVFLKNSQGQTLYELTNTSYIGVIAFNVPDGDTLLHIGPPSSFGINLNLYFTSPFDGVASVILHNGNHYSGVASANGLTPLTSGSSVIAGAAVPEPSSVIMLGLGSLGLMGMIRRSRRSPKAIAAC